MKMKCPCHFQIYKGLLKKKKKNSHKLILMHYFLYNFPPHFMVCELTITMALALTQFIISGIHTLHKCRNYEYNYCL